MKSIRYAVVALMLTPAAGAAQDFEAGLDAVEAGDYATALQEWRPLAEQGRADAQAYLGVMYNFGEGVPLDHAEAVRWYRLAAEQGNTFAQFNLGVKYHNGQGVPQDYAEAARWYRRAAEKGDVDAQNNLGSIYGLGQGMPRDYVTAHMWLNIAAANGLDQAAKTRAVVEGQMTPADISEAQRRARVCINSGYQECD
jgi:uncharacterized protein